MSGIKFLLVEEINSTGDNLLLLVKDELYLGRILPTHSRLRTLARESCVLFRKANITVFFSYSAGSVYTFSHFLQLGLSLYLVSRETVSSGHFLLAPVPDITSNRLLFRM